MVNCAESKEKTDNCISSTQYKLKETKSELIENHLRGMKGVVKKLESSLTESHLDQRHMLIQMHMDDIKSQSIVSQMEEARKENGQLLNILQQKSHDNDLSRSQIDVYSTMSVVNLQYKYEELLAKYDGLLKIMTARDKDIQKCHKDNESSREELNRNIKKLYECEYALKKVCDKYMALKKRKDIKIRDLKREKETLRLAHNQVVTLLHHQCMKTEDLITQQLYNTFKPERALLLREVKRSNKYYHENIMLKQEIACLKSKCSFPKLQTPSECSSTEKIKSDR